MKTPNLLLTALLSGTMLVGCIDLSSDDEDTIAAAAAEFLDGYEEEQNEDVSTSEALEKNYIEETEVTEDSAVGSARIGGEIDVESLNRSLAKMASRSMGSRAQLAARAVDALNASNFSVSFINGKGQLVELTISSSDILIHQPSTGNPQFIIEGMGDGINYIIEIMVTIDGGEPIDLKTLAFVPTGETKSEKAVLDPISTVITEAIKDKVVNSFFETGGDTLAQSYIADLTETLVVSIENALADNPDLSASDFETAIGSDSGVDDLVAKLLSDEDIAGDLNKIEDAAVADTFAVPEDFATGDEGQAEARNIVEELLNNDKDGEGGGAPQFFIDFFGDQYQLGTTKTVNEVIIAIFNGIEFDVANTPQEVLDELTPANALTAFTTELIDIYVAIDEVAALEANDNLTDAEENELHNVREKLSDINLLLGIFPPERKDEWQNLSANSDLSVPQAISIIFFVLDNFLDGLKSQERGDDGQLEESDGVDFDPITLLELYGFDTTNVDQQALYANLEVNWLDLHPGRVWLSTANDGLGGEVDILNMFTCVDAYPEELFEVASVSLTYPTSTGTNTIPLTNESDLYGDDNGGGDDHRSTCYTLNPWAEADVLAQSGNPEYGSDDQGGLNYDAIWRDLVDSGVVVTDFVSGDYTLTVEYSEEGVDQADATFTFDRRIITGLSGLFPEFTSPQGFPRFPEGNASPDEYDAFNEAVNSFNMTTFATADTAVFTWNEPALLADNPLPEGIIAVYNLDIGRDVCTENEEDGYNECHWEHVFSSWETGSQIFGTTFELPQEGKDQLLPLALTDTPYQANLNIDFIDENTGEFVGSGGWAQAPFRVGETLDLTQTFNLTGNVTGAPDTNYYDSTTDAPYLISQYKVAAVKESCEEDTSAEPFVDSYFDEEQGQFVSVEYFPWICSSETLAISPLTDDGDGGHTYTIAPTLQEMMGNSQNSWIDVRMFIDANGDGVIDQGTEANNYFGEPQFWSMSYVNFNSWGGVLRVSRDICDENNNCNYSEDIVIPGETYDGPDFEVYNDGTGGGGNGGDNGGEQNINAFFLPFGDDQSFLDSALEWGPGPNIFADDIEGYRIVLFSIDPSSADPEPLEARIVEVPNTMDIITLDQMVNGGTDIVDITTEALADENATEGSDIGELTTGNLTEDKTYIWIVEAFDAEGNDIGESNDVFLSPPPTN